MMVQNGWLVASCWWQAAGRIIIFSMSTIELRREIKKAVDKLPSKQLESLVDYVHFLNRPTIAQRIAAAEKSFVSGKAVNWRKVR
jgi:hypothetical protein